MSDDKHGDVHAIGRKNPDLPFDPAVRAGDSFVAGPAARGADGNVPSGTIAAETVGIIEAIRRIGAEPGVTLAGVMEVTTALEDAREFGRYNNVFSQRFKNAVLARATIEARTVIMTGIAMDASACQSR